MERLRDAMNQEFRRDIEDGTIDVFVSGDELRLDGGNWDLIVFPDGRVATDLPMNDPNYYDEVTDQFLDNVLGTEVYESLARLDARFDGAIVYGLQNSGESWSVRLGERLAAMPPQSQQRDH